ncbi:MAG: tyrosine-type recombinase/integrase [Armatimonadetes bacterium]|nr:tyrosine-type recombinase/integrase [Armatimonadota bacterium]
MDKPTKPKIADNSEQRLAKQDTNLPALLAPLGQTAVLSFQTLFAAKISNSNTRDAYLRDVRRFFLWCSDQGIAIASIDAMTMATYRETLERDVGLTSVKRHFSALRRLFGTWVETGVIEANPAREVETKRISRTVGKTPALEVDDVRLLFQSLRTNSLVGLRDRALIGVLAYTFARISAVCNLRARDYFSVGRTTMLRLLEKGGQEREIPCNHQLEQFLDEFVAASKPEPSDFLFASAIGRTGALSKLQLGRQDAWAMIQRRIRDAGVVGHYCNHSFRATGITRFLENGGSPERAQRIAGHADIRTTMLYDRRCHQATLTDLELVRY